ncbi:molybdopterin-dependent oxidoreductase [Nocardioides panacis]|uniref:Molybdopterin-dependent oxidoreductase n=1 Tax=Nocardioides panacis TaxID=2849501 RepID=A0A975T048_9ACTN|nr:molybdopterin-dependent oxidoreductase [Nocardioides panacis]QWZ09134.1 molybdopterin-dependent oxidoreductase [Nocardioides panacis]
MEQKLGVCNLCEAICGLVFTLDDGPGGRRVTDVRGNPDDPLSRGHICPKAVALQDVHEDPDRLRRPVRRVGEEWHEVSWDEALDLVAENLARAVNEHGRDALALYLGNPNVHSLGSMTHGTAMVKSFRTRNKYSATSVDQLPAQMLAYLMYGHQLMLPVPDLDRTAHFLVFGANPMASNGSLMTVPDFPARLRELKARGGRMVVVDPRRTETAKAGHQHHFVRPGTDAFVLLAMLHVLFEEGLTTPPSYVDGLDAVRAAVLPFTPERAETASGVGADVVRRLARELAAAESAAVYGRVGVSTQEFGLVATWAVQLLNLVTGNLDRPGGVMLTRPAVDAVGRGLVGRGHHDLWRSRVRGLPEFGGELPVATLADEILTPGEGQVRALLTVAGNPVSSTPDGKRLGEAIAGLDFVAAVDLYVNETTRHADVILPPTSALERDHYDLVFHVLAVRNTARFTPALFDKPEGALHDWEIYREIVLRTQRRLAAKRPLKRRLLQQARMRVSPTRTIDLLLRTDRARLSVARLRRGPVDLGPLEPCLPERLMTPGHRVVAAPPQVLDDLVRLDASPAGSGGLLLVGRRHQRDNNSWMHNTPRLTKGRARHQLLMHPDDLSERAIPDGTVVRVASAVGEVDVEVQASTDMMPGVVSLPHGYGHRQRGVRLAHAVELPGASMNDLTDPSVLDVSGNAVLSGVPVTVSRR